MEFIKAQELLFKPYIAWYTVRDFEDGDPLVIPLSGKPINIFDVCPWKIVGGELVARTAGEMEVFEQEYLAEVALRTEERKIDSLDGLTFNYGGKTYPMNEAARLYYYSIDKYRTGAAKLIKSLTGVETLPVGEIDAFLEEYYKILQGTLSPN